MRHDQAGKFDALTGFFFAGLRAHRDRKCQQCKTELITGEPVFRIHASFMAVNNHQYSSGAYCVPCATAKMEEMKAKLGEASEWLTAQHKTLESYFVAKTLSGEKDRGKLTSMLRKLVPANLCSRCFHERSEHHHFQSIRYSYEGGKQTQTPIIVWKCGHSDSQPSEEGTVRCCGCNHGPKIKQPEPVVKADACATSAFVGSLLLVPP